MSGRYDGRLDHIISVTGSSGFAGIEPETRFLGKLSDPELLKEALQESNLEMCALTLVEDWRGAVESDGERSRADACIDILQHFPGTILNLCQMPGSDRDDLLDRQRNACRCINEIGARAFDRGVVAGFHPNSPAGSIFRIESDYQFLFDSIDFRYAGFIPDTGHIAKGGMDPKRIISSCLPWVRHVHFKDMFLDGRWAPLGDGCIDHIEIASYLASNGYSGWIVVEDECLAAEKDPDSVARLDGKFTSTFLSPIFNL